MDSLPRALQNPYGHKTGKVKSRGVGHNSHQSAESEVFQYSGIPQVFLLSLLLMVAVLTGSMQHRGQQQVSQTQNKRHGPRDMIEQPSVLSWNCSMVSLNNRWPEDTDAFPKTPTPPPQPINSKAHEKEQDLGCATTAPGQAHYHSLPTISRHTGSTGHQKLSSQLPTGRQSLGLESTKMGETTDGKHLSQHKHDIDAVTRTAG